MENSAPYRTMLLGKDFITVFSPTKQITHLSYCKSKED